MKRSCFLLAFSMFVASGTQAAPIIVSAGNFVTFNFDLTGETPPPPYSLVGINTQLDVSTLDFEPPPCGGPGGLCELLDIGVWTFWTDLNGTGSIFRTAEANLGAQYSSDINSGINDGVFSATLQMTEGSITVDPIACGIVIAPDGSRTGTPACGLLPPPPVPEPGTLSLLACAAAALVARRRGRSAHVSRGLRPRGW